MNFWAKFLKCDLGILPYNQFSTADNSINYINWWESRGAEDIWFTKFIRKNVKCEKNFFFYSVFGSPLYIKRRSFFERNSINIFYTGENVSASGISRRFRRYSNHMLDVVDFSMGFEYIEDRKYFRFPLWITYLFPPDSTYKTVKEIINKINTQKIDVSDRVIECSNVSRHDKNGIRGRICDSISEIVDINYDGIWRNNSVLLREEYRDNKKKYLSHVKFNICPENANESGYVTEKIFESLYSGAIPIYWGANGHPEGDIINQDAFLYWDGSKSFNERLELLSRNGKEYEEFATQRRFKEGAEDIIWNYFEILKSKINLLGK